MTKKKNPEDLKKRGIHPDYETPEELQVMIDEYFNSGLTRKDIKVGYGKEQQVISVPVPTITGLCYYLGFASRQSFYDYEKKPDFTYTIKRARLFIEKEYEEQLQIGNTTGAIFALKNMGWIDKQEHEHSGNVNNSGSIKLEYVPVTKELNEDEGK